MRLGIVGHEEAKFTVEGKTVALTFLDQRIKELGATSIVSGGCHLGGVDIWAEELAARHGLPMTVYKPKNLRWEPEGYRERNLKIAENSDYVICVVVERLPLDYKGMRFKTCYHCKGRNGEHVKSGGCWTAWRAKEKEWVVVSNRG